MTQPTVTELEIIRQAMKDIRQVEIILEFKQVWFIVSALQIATLHPDLSLPMTQQFDFIAAQLIAILSEFNPAGAAVLAKGSDRKHDEPQLTEEQKIDRFQTEAETIVNLWFKETHKTAVDLRQTLLKARIGTALESAYRQGRAAAEFDKGGDSR